MPELPEVEVVRRDLEREIVGKRIKDVEVDGMRTVRRHHNRKQFINRLVGRKFTGRRPARQVPPLPARRRRRARRPPRDVGPAAAREDRARGARQAHPRRDQLPAGRPAPIRRPPHVRRDVRDGVRRRRDRGHGARAPRHGSALARDVVGALRFAHVAAPREAQVAAHGPEVHGRYRQHLQRRDPLGCRTPLGPHERHADRPGDPPPLPGDDGDVAGRREVPRLVTRGRAVRRPLRQARRVPAPPQRVRPRRRVLPAVPRTPSSVCASGAGPPSSAIHARCDEGARLGVGARAGGLVPGVVPRGGAAARRRPAGSATSPTGGSRPCSRAIRPRSTPWWRGATKGRCVPGCATSSASTSSRPPNPGSRSGSTPPDDP